MILTIRDNFESCERIMEIIIAEEEFLDTPELNRSMLTTFKAMYGDLNRRPDEIRA